jgi:tRNA modification GTPase
MIYKQDTISAISTPVGVGGISIIRVSGSDSINVVSEHFTSNLSSVKSHTAVFGKFTVDDQIIDEVLITVFKAPNSYTGEDVVEISCHGNPFVTNKILEILLFKTRLADKGEFTQRAFFNNKIDLIKAEAVSDLLDAKTMVSHRSAIEQLEGSLSNKIKKLLQKLTEFRTLLELEIDFSESGDAEVNVEKLKNDVADFKQELKNLANSGAEGRILREGLKVSLVGAPNVGKSSIFNRFLETERAIVTPIAGTTRDYLEEAVSLEGYLIRIFDTAGIRSSSDEIEKIGIERSYDIIRSSDKVLFITVEEENTEELNKLKQMIDESKIIKILNKSDELKIEEIDKFKKKGYLICSAVKEEGLREIKDKLLADIRISDEELHSGILTNTRQISAVKKALDSVGKALDSLEAQLGFEFTAFDLQVASSSLEEIIGRITTDDILNDIFDNFCIGK